MTAQSDFSHLKEQFSLPKNSVYLCGHSLGPMPNTATTSVQQSLQAWSHLGVAAWNEADWINLPVKLGQQIAPLIGANQDEVIVTDSTSINLLKLLLAAISLNPTRNILLTECDNFPADLYMAESIAKLQPHVTVNAVPVDNLLESMNENVAVLLLTHVNYRTSDMHDMKAICHKAHTLGILVLMDLSHSVGAMPLYCSEFELDFAVGCTYKYLNGGPGSPSFLYINQKHLQRIAPMIQGWMGHITPFAFSQNYEKAKGISSFLTGTPFILSMKALEGALQIFTHSDLAALRAKNISLSTFLITQLENKVPTLHCESPLDPLNRGSHVAFSHPNAYAISRALIEHGIIVDYREPHLIRFGIAALYMDDEDIEKVVTITENVVNTRIYDTDRFLKRLQVT